MTVEPIKPSEVRPQIPDVVFEVFNEIIEQNYNGKCARVSQGEAVKHIMLRSDLDKEIIFTKGFLDIEEHYRNAGWSVTYFSPDRGGSDRAYFKFTG